MSSDELSKVQAAIDHVLELAAELEVSGTAVTEGSAVAHVRAVLHAWVDTVTAVALTPAFGRSTLIHENGQQSSVQSSVLAYALSTPVGPRTD
ncbi:hypothetical protein LWE61_04240 [Sphingobium sufflavum]|uniref:hypothetical protein n=1 Tax=Sphingobium sufflavum TaxID=1129547 RepID=UPI001F24BAE7|nr:hypothetical protein [Sphingobium sufflavum]MCE7795765.1 hypothetical protein [Sphingobium sufflavum]